ncbi:Aminodeoxychorismate lyase [Botryosphaeria dothidea]
MLRYHRDRMLEAAQHFEWTEVAKKLADGKALEVVLNHEIETWRSKNNDPKSPLKVRVLFNRDGAMQTDIATTPPLQLSSLYPATFTPPSPQPPPPAFTPSPKTGGALALGPDDALKPAASPKTSWILTVDTAPTPTSPHTLLKTTHRAHYDAAKQRSVPDEAAVPAGGQLHEVLLWNSVGEMTEGSFTSAYFFRGGRWVTPPVGVPNNVSDDDDDDDDDGEAAVEKGKKEEDDAGTLEQVPRSVADEGELREPFAGRWGHSIRSVKATAVSGGQRGTTRRWALKKGLCMEEPVSRETVKIGEEVWVSNGVRGFGLGRVVEAKKVE